MERGRLFYDKLTNKSQINRKSGGTSKHIAKSIHQSHFYVIHDSLQDNESYLMKIPEGDVSLLKIAVMA